jgi:hypothetical protein
MNQLVFRFNHFRGEMHILHQVWDTEIARQTFKMVETY